MNQKMSEEELYRRARERVEDKKGFYIHFVVYVFMSIAFYFIWYYTGPGYRWYIWPILGWGIGVLFHFLGVFVFSKTYGWEDRAVEREVARMRRK